MKKTKENSEHYYWGDGCSGWHLVKSDHLSVIEELMPAHTFEQKHYHNFSEQYFYVLNGIATFEIGKELVEVHKNEGIHVLPQVVHQIRNENQDNLKFLVISQPTTKGDRINDPFKTKELSLNGKKFRSVSSSTNGKVDAETIFEYRQNGNVVWAIYTGGEILFGTLSGRIEQKKLFFTYQHQNKNGDFKTGKCYSFVELKNDGVLLKEQWEWTCDDYSKGESILEEIVVS